MFEIKVNLTRTESAVYLTGEQVECFIEFSNKPSTENQTDCKEEKLAWASAQLHCYRKTNYTVTSADKVSELTDHMRRTALDTVTQSVGDVLVATKPQILFCDLTLQPNETKTYFFREYIPRDGPPTYRGHDIKYFYKITIAMQRVKSKVQTLTVPIRVLPIPIISQPDEFELSDEAQNPLSPTNPFIVKRELSELETSWHRLKNLTARRAPKYYRISNKHGMVGRFCLFKPCYKLGEDIVGSMNFNDCKVRCVQFCVKLQSQEISLYTPSQTSNANATNAASGEFSDASSLNSLDLASVASGSVANEVPKKMQSLSYQSSTSKDEDDEPQGKISTHSTYHTVCYATLETHVIVPIPLHITPTFQTDMVDVRWRLHFEFVTSTLMDFGQPIPESGGITAPAELPIETMVWNLPITLYTANPQQIYAPSQVHTLTIK